MADERLIAALTAERFGGRDHLEFRTTSAGFARPDRPFVPTDRTVHRTAADTPEVIRRRRQILCSALNPVNERPTELPAAPAVHADAAPDNVVFLDRYRRGAA